MQAHKNEIIIVQTSPRDKVARELGISIYKQKTSDKTSRTPPILYPLRYTGIP
jgi:hypothetical protein